MVIGEHEGAIFYTIGQRQGMGVGGGLPYYVTGKDMAKNEVYVTSDISDPHLWADTMHLSSVHLIGAGAGLEKPLYVRTRHRAPLVRIKEAHFNGDNAEIILDQKLRALTPGQSAVFYTDTECLGGGVISSVK
jgi:tRNA-specific 2-thiouridylase